MKFRNFFALGSLFSLAFLIITGVILYLSPNTSLALVENQYIFGLNVNIWKTQFIFSFILLVIFLILFLIKLNWKSINSIIINEFPNKLWNSPELWSSLIIVFIIIALAGSDISMLNKLAGTDNDLEIKPEVPSDNTADNINVNIDLRNVSLADLTFEQIAENYQNMTGEFVLDKIKDDGLACPEDAKTIGDISTINNYPVNEVIRIIGAGELLSKYNKNGKPIKNRTISDASIETGIPIQHIYKILESNELVFSSNDDQTFANIALGNDYSPKDIYGLLNNNGQKGLPKKDRSDDLKEFVRSAASMTISQLSSIIKQQQPDAEVNSEIIFTRLSQNDIKYSSKDITISEIAKENNVKITDILKIASFGSKQDPNEATGMQRVDGPPSKSDNKEKDKKLEFIQTPLSELATKYNIDTDDLLKALNVNGIKAAKSETIEEIARNNNQRPGPIIKILREERKKQQ